MKDEQFYKNKREKVKEEKRSMKDMDFLSSKHRKKFREGIDRWYRSLKRSERQDVQKHIDEEINKSDEGTESQ